MSTTVETHHTNNARIAKNTAVLYVRQLFMMVISLITSRVVLSALGIEDYGVYNVVGGVVTMFSIITGSLSNAISRFLAVGLGGEEPARLKKIFSTSVTIQLLLAGLVALLLEFIGVWFVNYYLNIPNERVYAANWVLQYSIISFCLGLISVPYNAAIIAHEKMNVFAYTSLLEGVMKLIMAYCLYIVSYDKLITYSFLVVIVSTIMRVIYGMYCKNNFEECRYHFYVDKALIKEMSSFAGWNFLCNMSVVFYTQGLTILINMYFGVISNAARGVATQVDNIIKTFVANFTTAINPQIMKSYSCGDIAYTYKLANYGSKFSYLLMLLFAIPFWFETESILSLWLKEYPVETPLFLRLALIGTMIDISGNSVANAVWATGKIKKYYLTLGSFGLTVLPLSWFLFELGLPAFTCYIVFIIVYFIIQILRLFIAKEVMGFPINEYLRDVVAHIIPITLLSLIIPTAIYYYLDATILRSVIIVFGSLLSTSFIIFLSLSNTERQIFLTPIVNKLKDAVNRKR